MFVLRHQSLPARGSAIAAAVLTATILCACEPTRSGGIVVPRPLTLNLFDGKASGTRELPVARRDALSICHGHTCRYIAVASFNDAQWREVEDSMTAGIPDAVSERVAIGRTIGIMERIVGAQTGTGGDLGENWTRHGASGQMDCIDESSNTLTYLGLLGASGLLRWHSVGARLNRGPFTLLVQFPHSAAGLIDNANGDRFAVDSWFLGNGEPAFVVPYEIWARGFRPPA